MKKIISSSILALMLVCRIANAQSIDELNKFRIAQTLEQAGEFEKALPFYRQLYNEHPGNFVYFDGLRRTYLSLRDYSDAAALINNRLESDPNDVVLLSQLGDLYYKEGKADSATIVWNQALAVSPKDLNAYRFVAETMVKDNLYDRAVEVYKEGEEKTGSRNAFVTDIAHVYFLNLNYKGSIRELLELLGKKSNPSAYTYVESQIAAYSSSKQAMDDFTEEMIRQVKDNSDNIDYRRILAFLYMEEKDYPAAHGIYRWLDKHLKAGGAELLSFADKALADGSFKSASDAYKEVSDAASNNVVAARALMGYANSMRGLGERNYSDDKMPCAAGDSLPNMATAVSTYHKVVTDFGNTEYGPPAVMNLIEIEVDYFHDYTAAERYLSKYRDMLGLYGNAVSFLRAKLYVMEGNLKAGLNEAQQSIVITKPEIDPFYRRMQYEAALALYYMGMYDSSTYFLKQISDDPSSDAANDAISLHNLISDNKGNPDALKEFASAQAMEMSNRIPEAAKTLEAILRKFPGMPLTANAKFDLASSYCKLGNVKEALKYYSEIAADSLGIFADRAQLRICDIYQETLHDKQKAISEYESFLMRFPKSIYQNKVRAILQELLGASS